MSYFAEYLFSDVVDRIVMAKPAIAIKKPNLGSAVKRTFYTSSSTASGILYNKIFNFILVSIKYFF